MTINCKGNLIDLTQPKVMGILNVTPDSFFDGGQHSHADAVLSQVDKMLREGATFIDVGGYSSRPNAAHVSVAEELDRVVPIVELLVNHFPEILISVDTFRADVAKACVRAGAAMINDISAGSLDETMLATVAKLRVPYCMMHMKGTPQTMQQQTDYQNLLKDILFYFSQKLSAARALGMVDLIVDPGFGFSKTREQNFELLRDMGLLQSLNVPILVGMSRKSMIYKTLDLSPNEALNGTTALHMAALERGANIVRVHDVAPAMECITLFGEMGLEGKGL